MIALVQAMKMLLAGCDKQRSYLILNKVVETANNSVERANKETVLKMRHFFSTATTFEAGEIYV